MLNIFPGHPDWAIQTERVIAEAASAAEEHDSETGCCEASDDRRTNEPPCASAPRRCSDDRLRRGGVGSTRERDRWRQELVREREASSTRFDLLDLASSRAPRPVRFEGSSLPASAAGR